jgi:type VI secretion system protein ImpE
MTPHELFQQGQLGAAIEALNQELKSHPTDAERRTFLFELLCFAGDYDRARKQLDVITQQSSGSEWATQVYGNILVAENKRSRLLTHSLAPEFLTDPPDYVHGLLDAVNRLREGNARKAHQVLQQVDQERPRLRGTANGRAFEDFRDCDDLFAPVLELIIVQDYVWVPLEKIRELEVAAPERPRDLIWSPVRIGLDDSSQRRGYLPNRYVGSAAHPDEQIKLGRMTDWLEDESGTVRGVGQRLFLAGDECLPVLEARAVQMQVES